MLNIYSNADAVVVNRDDARQYFVKPLETDEPFKNFIRYIKDQEHISSKADNRDVKYSQARKWNVALSQ